METISDKRRANMAKARAVRAENLRAKKLGVESQADDVLREYAEREAAVDRDVFLHRAVRTHDKNGRAVAMGRDGQELTRKRTVSSDIFHIPPEIIPDGWDYQWNVQEVIGQPQTATRLAMAENGWRPVPADRHSGMYMPEGYKGPIIRDGLQLEERPMALSLEARAEENAKARKQVADQQEQLMLSKKGALGDGFSDDPKYRGVGAVARQQYAPAPDIPRPVLTIDE